MARTKISKIAADLNIALPTVVDFLRKQNITVDDTPNARVEDAVVELLVEHFKRDKDLKTRSEKFSSERPQPKKKNEGADVEDIITSVETIKTPKIIGKIQIDKNGNPVTTPEKTAPKAETPAVKEVKKEEQPKKTETAEVKTEKVTSAVEVKTTPKVEEQPKKVEEKQQPKVDKPKKEEQVKKQIETMPTPQENKKDIEVKPTVEKVEESKSEKEEISTMPSETMPGQPSIKVVGKIDLDALNQSTRPKKKTKEEKRNDRIKSQQQSAAAQSGDKKKRKRIGGKEKVDIEKTAMQNSGNNQSRKDNNGGQRRDQQNGGGSRKEKPAKQDRNRKPIHTEVNEEDVQRQVKETLARLTSKDKGLKKGAKWRKEKREAFAEREREAAEMEQAESKVLKLTEFVTANDLASMMDVPVNQVIATCMNLGVMVSINQRLDAETINIVAEEFGYKTEYVSAEVSEAINAEEDSEEDLVPRPPIVTVMGHVDHGKTSLLDYIRNANVIAGEAGGITQHIGAYNVTLPDGKHITFLDTPGHEAFTAMRARGAKITDICIIIVAADDNVMPQTVEAINHASAAGVPLVFAINKIDKPHANPDKIKEELAGMNYLVEEWGGKYQSQDISAKKGIGVDELMEKVLLEAEMLDLKANPNRNATGSIIESSLDKGRGYVATVLVQNGTLRVGDIILAGTHFGKVKAMFNERNQRIKQAGPSEPTLILGLNGAPAAGDTFNVLDSEQEAREIATKREQLQRELGLRTNKRVTLEDIGRRRAIGNFQELNIIVKGDVDGSIEALSDSLIKLSTDEIQVNVLHKAVGEISESDVTLATASDAIIIGFQVRPSLAARREAEREGVQIRLYSVIYQAIEEVKDAMAGMLAPEVKEEVLGTAEVMETYHISKVGTIAGAMVREGKIKRSCKVRLIRDGIVRYTGELGSLKRFKDDVKEVATGYDCGLSIAGYNDLKVGDLIEAFEEVEVNRTL